MMLLLAILSKTDGACYWKIDVVEATFPYPYEPVVHNHLGHEQLDFGDELIRNFPQEVRLSFQKNVFKKYTKFLVS